MRRLSPRTDSVVRLVAVLLVLEAGLVVPAHAGVGIIELISRGDPPGDTTRADEAAVSAGGRFVAFTSEASNLVSGQVDRGATSDVFLFDRLGPATILVSRTASSPVTTGNRRSFSPALSADGRHVAFVSEATDLVAGLVPGIAPGATQVYLFDRDTGLVTLVSRVPGSATTTGNGPSGSPAVSADGRFVAFVSEATDLVAGQVDANQASDVFLYDREAGTTVLVSRVPGSPVTSGSRESSAPVVSADGEFVAFVSDAANLVPGQVDDVSSSDVFLYRRATGVTRLVSRIPGSAVTTGDSSSSAPQISADGAVVAFQSFALNLVAGQVDPGGAIDVFLYERDTEVTRLVSRVPGSTADAAGAVRDSVALSASGQFVALASQAQLATGLGSEDGTNVYLYDRQAGTTILVSRTPSGLGFADSPALSADGRYVAFRSTSRDAAPGQVETAFRTPDLFRYDRVADTTILVSHAAGSPLVPGNGASGEPVISADGRFVAFRSLASDLVAGLLDLNGEPDVYLHDSAAAETFTVSRRAPDRPGESGAGFSGLVQGGLSTDGRVLVFDSTSANLVPGQVDINHDADVFLHDRLTGTTTLISRAAGTTVTAASGGSGSAVISADGRVVAFGSSATDLVDGQVDFNFTNDVFLHDRQAGITVLVSRSAGTASTAGTHISGSPTLGADGRFVAFWSQAFDMITGQIDTNGEGDVFLYDALTATTVLVSRAAGSPVTTGDGASEQSQVSADGRFVAFDSQATNLVPAQADGNGATDVFLFERETGAVTLVSRTALSSGTTGNDQSRLQGISADGRLVLFASGATDLVPGQIDDNGGQDVFVHDRLTGLTSLISRTAGSSVAAANGRSSQAVMSADGRLVAFVSDASDLLTSPVGVAGDSNVFLHDRETGTTRLVTRRLQPAAALGGEASGSPVISGDGRFVAFASRVPDLLSSQHDEPTTLDIFLYDRLTEVTRLVSRTRAGRPAGSGAATADDESSPAVALSADGTVLAFMSQASDLTGERDENGSPDVFVLVRPCPDTVGSRPSGSCPGGAGRPAP